MIEDKSFLWLHRTRTFSTASSAGVFVAERVTQLAPGKLSYGKYIGFVKFLAIHVDSMGVHYRRRRLAVTGT